MVLLRVGKEGTGKVSFLGCAEFQMPEVHVNGDIQQAEERPGLDIWNWKFSASRERAKHIFTSGTMVMLSNYLPKPWAEIRGEDKRACGPPIV